MRDCRRRKKGPPEFVAIATGLKKEKIVSSSSSAYPKQDMFLLLNPRGEDDFTKTHLQQVLKLYSKELPDMNYASNTRKQSTFLERCVSKRPLRVTRTLFLPYDLDEPRASTLVHLIEVSRSALTEKAPYVAKANGSKVEYEKTRNSELRSHSQEEEEEKKKKSGVF
ncbi:hypothetical protein Bca52824_019771 [Brassica carinata]|uniref:Uncharacterized protein n=1 Tax=Brassica carinata TaxID=52824 RepID=A0A8X7VS14_BRACI|nr:hypothetical protein Bca52824_019771 [Brassica carinata]